MPPRPDRAPLGEDVDPRSPGTPHPRGVTLAPAALEALRTLLTRRIDTEVADAVIRFLTSTARTTIRRPVAEPDGTGEDAFVITGDIPAMWLRDSSAQVSPYLRLLDRFGEMDQVIASLLRRHWRMIRLDPYANAFNERPDGARWDDDDPLPGPWVWERKWEIDSLTYPLDLASRMLAAGSTAWADDSFVPALETILDLLETEQHHEERSDYRFTRPGADPEATPADTLAREGRGRLTQPCGMVFTAFRPSDDACEQGFNIPGNLFAAATLRHVDALLRAAGADRADLADRASALAEQIITGAARAGLMTIPDGGQQIIAYESDGAELRVLMDDANVPSLLSLPYLGVIAPDDPLYLATRAAVLSEANPTFVRGSVLTGIGSPHTPPGHVWPIALAVQGLTSTDDAERRRILHELLDTTGGTGHMHEGVLADDPATYTRPWFSWADAMFCELALETAGIPRPSLTDEPAVTGATLTSEGSATPQA